MATDYYANAFLATERVSARYQEAEAHRLANTVSKKGSTRPSVLKGIGRALNQGIQGVQAVIHRHNLPIHEESKA